MLKYAKAPALWLAIGLVLGSGALSFAATSNGHGQGPKPKPSVSAKETAEPDETETPEPTESEAPEQDTNTNANRPHNHGFFVSQAAHCEDVSDTDNSVEFTAPADCATNGQAHGGYVSQVAKSDAGKGPHGNSGK